jgi:putative spermidine/putrescine transport system substrate-binding protein
VADVTYLGVTLPSRRRRKAWWPLPAGWADIPEGLKDPQGQWFTIHSGTLGFMVNVDALHGKPVPSPGPTCSSPTTRA